MNQAAPIYPPLPADLQLTAEFIRKTQRPDGAIPWYSDGKLDPWDHTEAAMALSIAGYWREAEAAYYWLAQQQLSDGSWYANYFLAEAGDQHSELRETNFVAYVATGVWHHFLVSRNSAFLREMWSCVRNAVNFVLRFQSAYGEISWAVDANGHGQNDALLTACSSILRSLDCACRIARVLGEDDYLWRTAAAKLAECLRAKPERFDRTWESKARFSMDWYYPVLAGLYDRTAAQARLAQRWAEFVEPALGCRCVSDEPWVTMAETSELVMALLAAGQREQAHALFDTLAQWRDTDGGYWTGYVFRDSAIWPAEKTSWTAGAVLLAADALWGFSGGRGLFTTPLEVA